MFEEMPPAPRTAPCTNKDQSFQGLGSEGMKAWVTVHLIVPTCECIGSKKQENVHMDRFTDKLVYREMHR